MKIFARDGLILASGRCSCMSGTITGAGMGREGFVMSRNIFCLTVFNRTNAQMEAWVEASSEEEARDMAGLFDEPFHVTVYAGEKPPGKKFSMWYHIENMELEGQEAWPIEGREGLRVFRLKDVLGRENHVVAHSRHGAYEKGGVPEHMQTPDSIRDLGPIPELSEKSSLEDELLAELIRLKLRVGQTFVPESSDPDGWRGEKLYARLKLASNVGVMLNLALQEWAREEDMNTHLARRVRFQVGVGWRKLTEKINYRLLERGYESEVKYLVMEVVFEGYVFSFNLVGHNRDRGTK